jgi:hypothetical protein
MTTRPTGTRGRKPQQEQQEQPTSTVNPLDGVNILELFEQAQAEKQRQKQEQALAAQKAEEERKNKLRETGLVVKIHIKLTDRSFYAGLNVKFTERNQISGEVTYINNPQHPITLCYIDGNDEDVAGFYMGMLMKFQLTERQLLNLIKQQESLGTGGIFVEVYIPQPEFEPSDITDHDMCLSPNVEILSVAHAPGGRARITRERHLQKKQDLIARNQQRQQENLNTFLANRNRPSASAIAPSPSPSSNSESVVEDFVPPPM